MEYRELEPEIMVRAEGAVRVVTMNRPEALNAFNDRLHHAFLNVWTALHHDEGARVVIVTGEGRAFSAGGDIPGFERTREDMALRRRQQHDTLRLIKEMLGFPLPVIGAVNGPAVGLGCSIVGMSDIVLMSSKAFLSDPHVPVGIVAADGPASTFPFMTSMLRVKEYLFTGDRIPADVAERVGLANRVVEPEDLMSEAMALAERLAAMPPVALQDTKRALNLFLLDAAQRVLPYSLAAQSESFMTDDVTATIARFKK